MPLARPPCHRRRRSSVALLPLPAERDQSSSAAGTPSRQSLEHPFCPLSESSRHLRIPPFPPPPFLPSFRRQQLLGFGQSAKSLPGAAAPLRRASEDQAWERKRCPVKGQPGPPPLSRLVSPRRLRLRPRFPPHEQRAPAARARAGPRCPRAERRPSAAAAARPRDSNNKKLAQPLLLGQVAAAPYLGGRTSFKSCSAATQLRSSCPVPARRSGAGLGKGGGGRWGRRRFSSAASAAPPPPTHRHRRCHPPPPPPGPRAADNKALRLLLQPQTEGAVTGEVTLGC